MGNISLQPKPTPADEGLCLLELCSQEKLNSRQNVAAKIFEAPVFGERNRERETNREAKRELKPAQVADVDPAT